MVASRIAAFFGLKTKIKEKMDNDIISFSRDKGIDIYIKADKEEKAIILGTDTTFINNFDY